MLGGLDPSGAPALENLPEVHRQRTFLRGHVDPAPRRGCAPAVPRRHPEPAALRIRNRCGGRRSGNAVRHDVTPTRRHPHSLPAPQEYVPGSARFAAWTGPDGMPRRRSAPFEAEAARDRLHQGNAHPLHRRIVRRHGVAPYRAATAPPQEAGSAHAADRPHSRSALHSARRRQDRCPPCRSGFPAAEETSRDRRWHSPARTFCATGGAAPRAPGRRSAAARRALRPRAGSRPTAR